jgi:primosomal protein N' (replication factor Y) (superfamily II helicase)
MHHMHYYEILPLTKTGQTDQSFTYEYEEELKVGNLVTIPLRNRMVKGLITEKVQKPAYQTRSIAKVLTAEPPVTDIQLKLAKKVADFYFCSLGDAISAIFPFEFGKKRRAPKEDIKNTAKEEPLKLTQEQAKIVKEIEASEAGSKHLIFGVTGSGKTEIYLQLIAKAIDKDGGAIVLVPEIALTPQTVARFKKRFGNLVAVWHSQMKETEKYHTWQQIKSGEAKVVVGARSAIFAPIKNLNYIVIDEEHEGTYKQDSTPRYEAVRVAEWLADETGAKLVLGSATPKIESYHKAKEGAYALHQMNTRIVQEYMPPVKIVDLRQEFQKGNKSIFSDALTELIEGALAEKRQVLLFVNRRGAATFIVCRECGYVSECPRCDIPLTYHPSEGQILKCHHCDYKTQVPVTCPSCQSTAIKYFGLGTQKVELEAKRIFPKARVARMDRDTTAVRGAHEHYYQNFADNNLDILIGTQIIAKGWDLPNVAVVGVISADTTLNIPDFRSGERTFSLITQVAGRTGRGFHPGNVVIQTYAPENYALMAAAQHDYQKFYGKEIAEREKYHYPPFSHLAKLTYSSPFDEKAQAETEKVTEKIKELTNAETYGPVPAFIPKLGNRFRYHVIIKFEKESQINPLLKSIQSELKIGWVVDVHPETLL